MGNLGMGSIDDEFELVFMGYGPSAEALQNGQIEGMNTACRRSGQRGDQRLCHHGRSDLAARIHRRAGKQANGEFGELWVPYTSNPAPIRASMRMSDHRPAELPGRA
jgi:hypothetical protein